MICSSSQAEKAEINYQNIVCPHLKQAQIKPDIWGWQPVRIPTRKAGCAALSRPTGYDTYAYQEIIPTTCNFEIISFPNGLTATSTKHSIVT